MTADTSATAAEPVFRPFAWGFKLNDDPLD
jgi:hypothetical protein